MDEINISSAETLSSGSLNLSGSEFSYLNHNSDTVSFQPPDRIIGIRPSNSCDFLFTNKNNIVVRTYSFYSDIATGNEFSCHLIHYYFKMSKRLIPESFFLKMLRSGNKGILWEDWKVLSCRQLPDDPPNMLVYVGLTPQAADQVDNKFNKKVRIGISGLVELRKISDKRRERILKFRI